MAPKPKGLNGSFKPFFWIKFLVVYIHLTRVTNKDVVTNCSVYYVITKNSLHVPCLQTSNIELKIGPLITMLPNLNQQKLYNGTHLVVNKLIINVIHSTILKRKSKVRKLSLRGFPWSKILFFFFITSHISLGSVQPFLSYKWCNCIVLIIRWLEIRRVD